MLVHSLLFVAAVMGQPAIHAPAKCEQFLVGHWAGKGSFTGMGTPMQVDNAYHYKQDGSFATINRYLGQDKRWHEQKLTGSWSAKPGRSRDMCILELKSGSKGMESSSTSEIQMIGKDVFRSLGFDMRRVPAQR